MRGKTWILGLSLLSTLGCSSMNNTEKGMLGGAAVGTGAGALLGRGHPGAMLVGGLLGTAVGGIAGSEQDRRDDRRAWAQAQANAQAQRQMSVPEVIQLSQRGTSDDIIINQIHSTGSVFNLTTNDLIDLQNHNVSNRVIAAMQARRIARPVVVAPAPPPEVVYVAPPPPPPPGFGVGVVIGR